MKRLFSIIMTFFLGLFGMTSDQSPLSTTVENTPVKTPHAMTAEQKHLWYKAMFWQFIAKRRLAY